MEQWTDQAVVLSSRAHGEGAAVVSLLSAQHGRHAGYVHGGGSSRLRGTLQSGTLVTVTWQSRVHEQLGSFKIEPEKSLPVSVLNDSLQLLSLQSACALCDAALPEREGHAGLYYGLCALLKSYNDSHWAYAYVMWEIQLLRELGFRLVLDRCAAKGDSETLCYVSPKSGQAVSAEKAAPYQDKLLVLPDFLRPPAMREGRGEAEDIALGLKMTGYFLDHWAFAHHTQGVPQARILFGERFEIFSKPA